MFLGAGGRISGHHFAQEASPGEMLAVTEGGDCVPSLDMKSHREKGSAPYSLHTGHSMASQPKGSADADWREDFSRCP